MRFNRHRNIFFRKSLRDLAYSGLATWRHLCQNIYFSKFTIFTSLVLEWSLYTIGFWLVEVGDPGLIQPVFFFFCLCIFEHGP